MPELTRRLGAAALLCAALLAAPLRAEERPVIVAVNAPLAEFAARLAGGAAEVVLPVPEGVDATLWRPAIAEIQQVQQADLILLNGAGFAQWAERVSLPRARVVDTSRGFADRPIETEAITHSHGPDGAHSHARTAAFTFLDPALAALQAEAVANALAARGLVPEAELTARRDALAADLAALAAAAERIAEAGDGAVLIATHPRYHYLARATGLTIHALDWEAGAAPDAARLSDLAARAAETGAVALLWEAEPPAEARAAVRALGLADAIVPSFAAPAAGDFSARLGAALAKLETALAAPR